MNYRNLTMLLAVLGMSLTGCKSLDFIQRDSITAELPTGENDDVAKGKKKSDSKDKDSPWWKKEDLPPVGKPAKIVAIWANSVFSEPGSGPMRGLGGRVYFYDAKHKPVRVDGSFTVFLYDDTSDTKVVAQEATKKVVFTGEEVEESYTPTEFGPSYSFWIPWDAVGGESTKLSVIPVYKAVTGEMLVGEQARYVLPGKKPTVKPQPARRTQAGKIFPASFAEEVHQANQETPDSNSPRSASEAKSLRIRSSTIQVPPSVQQRLRRPISSQERQRVSQATKATPMNATHRQQTHPGGDARGDFASVPSENQRGLTPARERRSLGQRPGVVRVNELAKPSGGAAALSPGQAANGATTVPPSAHSPLGSLQAPTSPFARQAPALDPSLLDRAKSLFGRGQ